MRYLLSALLLTICFAQPVFADTLTVYPDPDPETSTVDGIVYSGYASPTTWATIHGNVGPNSYVNSNADGYYIALFQKTGGSWSIISRHYMLFDTSALTAGATISAATLSMYGISKLDEISASPVANIYSSSPASNTTLATSDYLNVGSTAFATGISYASWSTSGYNDFALNASGLAAISKTGVSKFSGRFEDDANNTEPSAGATGYTYMGCSQADHTGTSQDPKLVITYTAAGGGAATVVPTYQQPVIF